MRFNVILGHFNNNINSNEFSLPYHRKLARESPYMPSMANISHKSKSGVK